MDGLIRQVIDTAMDGVWMVDLHGATVHANQACADLLGVSLDRLLTTGPADHLDEVGRVQWAQHLADLRAGKANTGPVDVSFVLPDGSHRRIRVRESLLRDDDGDVIGVLHRLSGSIANAERVRELAEAKRSLEEAHRIAGLGQYVWDLRSDEVHAHESVRTLLGYAPEHFPMSSSDIRDILCVDDLPELEKATQALAAGADWTEATVRIADAEGRLRWFTARGRVHHDWASGKLEVRGTLQDVDERRRLELQLEKAVAQLEVMRAVAQVSNRSSNTFEALVMLRDVLLRHPGALRARGFLVDSDGSLVRYAIDDLQTDDRGADEPAERVAEEIVAARCRDEAEVVWDDSGEPWRGAFPIVGDAGTVAVVVLAFSRAEVNDSGSLRDQIAQARDIVQQVHEREKVSNQLADARDEAELALQAKTDFLAMMSHEIRTPLNGVLGLNELLQRSRLTPRQRELTEGIRATGRHLLLLINDVLDFSKMEAGSLELEHIDLDLRGTVEGAAGMIAGQAAHRGIDLCVVVDPRLPSIVNGDPTRLAQVVTNLVSNAVKFTEEGSVTVRVDPVPRAEGAAGDSGESAVPVRLSVADTGVGIPVQAQQHIFAEFGQAEVSTSRTHGGTGLGLAICRRIVEAYGGTISVVSAPGEGSTFTCDLALGEATGPADNPLDAELAATWRHRTVVALTASDERFAMACDRLAPWGPRVLRAADADEAERLTAGTTDLGAVLIDLARGTDDADTLDADGLRRVHAVLPADARLIVLGREPRRLASAAGLRDSALCLSSPVSTAALRDALGDAPVETPAPAAPVSARGLRVLVVEDNPVNQMVAVGMLELLGYDHEVVAHGEEALQAFDPARHALVLMDVQMPVLDGYETTRRLHRAHPGLATPVIAMTASALEDERDRCLAAGMTGYLTKPIDVSRLGATLREQLAASVPAQQSPSQLVVPEQATCGPDTAPRTTPAWAELRGGLDGVLDTERIDDLLDMGPGAESLVTPAVARLISSLPEELENLLVAYRDRQGDSIVAAAHRMAGSALNMGVTAVGEAARQVEEDARRDVASGSLAAMVEHLAREVRRAVPVLEQCLSSLLPADPSELVDEPEVDDRRTPAG